MYLTQSGARALKKEFDKLIEEFPANNGGKIVNREM
jgi:hypothetical protein